MAELTSALAQAQALERANVLPRTALFAAQTAVAVFTTAYEDWIADPAADLDVLMWRALADLRDAVGLGSRHATAPTPPET
jgi:hypothetical protein